MHRSLIAVISAVKDALGYKVGIMFRHINDETIEMSVLHNDGKTTHDAEVQLNMDDPPEVFIEKLHMCIQVLSEIQAQQELEKCDSTSH